MSITLSPLLRSDYAAPTSGINLTPLLDGSAQLVLSGVNLSPLLDSGGVKTLSLPMNVPLVGLSSLMGGILGHTTPGPLTLKLFTNNIWPTGVLTAESFTEMVGQGYAPSALSTSGWTLSRNAVGVSVAAQAKVTWQFTAGNSTIYGYYVVAADGALRWAGRFARPFLASTSADRLSLTPKMSFRMLT